MNVVNAGSRYMIYGEDVKTYKELPLGTYDVSFNKNMGFFLVARADLVVGETKVYGNSETKVAKILRSFSATERNLGVILSGQKGIGKSLFARVLASKAHENNLPLINVSMSIPGIADFISSINQPCIVLFDEFEKVFYDNENDNTTPQEELLSLFDGIDAGHKLFIITCNEINQLNEYLLNRPGRFHYHFIMRTPSSAEIDEYLKDKLIPAYYDLIPRIQMLGAYANITYDTLRALVFELNNGYSLNETLEDLNIEGVSEQRFNIVLTFNDGSTARSYYSRVDTTKPESRNIRLVYENSRAANDDEMLVSFIPKDLYLEEGERVFLVPVNKIKVRVSDNEQGGWTYIDSENSPYKTLRPVKLALEIASTRVGNKLV